MAAAKKITPEQIISVLDGLKVIGIALLGIITLFKKRKPADTPLSKLTNNQNQQL